MISRKKNATIQLRRYSIAQTPPPPKKTPKKKPQKNEINKQMSQDSDAGHERPIGFHLHQPLFIYSFIDLIPPHPTPPLRSSSPSSAFTDSNSSSFIAPSFLKCSFFQFVPVYVCVIFIFFYISRTVSTLHYANRAPGGLWGLGGGQPNPIINIRYS